MVCTSFVSSLQNLLTLWGRSFLFLGSRCCRNVFNWLHPLVHLYAEPLTVFVMIRCSPMILLVLVLRSIFLTCSISSLDTRSASSNGLCFMVRLHHARGRCAQELSCIAGYHGVLVAIIAPSSTEKLDTTAQIQVSQGPGHKVTIAVNIKETTGRVHYVFWAGVLRLANIRTTTGSKLFAEARGWPEKWIINKLTTNYNTRQCKFYIYS